MVLFNLRQGKKLIMGIWLLCTMMLGPFSYTTWADEAVSISENDHLDAQQFYSSYEIPMTEGVLLDDKGSVIGYEGDSATVYLPKDVHVIEEGAFEDNQTIERVISQYEGYSDFIVKEAAFKNCRNLKTLEVNGYGSLYVGDEAFMNCYSLVTYVFSDVHYLYHVGNRAFYNCWRLYLEAGCFTGGCGIQYVGEEAFRNCGLIKIYLDGNFSIGDYAFADSGITSVVFSTYRNRESCIGKGAFENCKKLTSALDYKKMRSDDTMVDISIEEDAFRGCIELQNFDFEHVAHIGSCAFIDCPKITKVTLADSIKSIDSYALGYQMEGKDCVKNMVFALNVKDGTVGGKYAILNGFKEHDQHTYKMVFAREADCQENGEQQYQCELCDEIKTVEFPKLSHKYEIMTVEKVANKVKEGCVSYACVYCGDTIEVLTPKDDADGSRFRVGDFTYQIISQKKRTVKAVRYHGSEDDLKISATVKYHTNRYKVTAFSTSLLEDVKNLKKLTIGKNIEKIPSKAFKNNKKIKQIIIESKKAARQRKKLQRKLGKKVKITIVRFAKG